MSTGFDSTISLAKLSAKRYKVQLDEAWFHERPEVKRGNRHWYEQIPCENGGVIYLYSETERLLTLVTGKIIGKRILQEVNGAKLRLEAWREMEILFPAEMIHQVAEIAGARRKRHLSSEQRAQLIESGRATQFSGKNHGAEAQKKPRKSTPPIEHEETRPRLIRRVAAIR